MYHEICTVLPWELDRNCNVMRSHEMGGNSITCPVVTPFKIYLGLGNFQTSRIIFFIYTPKK